LPSGAQLGDVALVTVPAAAGRVFAAAAAVLLIVLAATSAVTAGHGFAGWARLAGVLAAGVLGALRAPPGARRSPSWCSPPR